MACREHIGDIAAALIECQPLVDGFKRRAAGGWLKNKEASLSVKYFIKLDRSGLGLETDWKEVTVKEFIRAERVAGFRGRGQENGNPATAGFTGNGVRGRVEYDALWEGVATNAEPTT